MQLPFVGASLLAKAVCQTTSMLNVRQHSRAGSLPQGKIQRCAVLLAAALLSWISWAIIASASAS
ncbi:hypothetical protein C0J26_16855 [Pseudomonas baetica]|nr:hypothetical protein C0J26_16855 [Pseudomonas baetica]